MIFEVLGNLVKHCLEFLIIYIFSIKTKTKEKTLLIKIISKH